MGLFNWVFGSCDDCYKWKNKAMKYFDLWNESASKNTKSCTTCKIAIERVREMSEEILYLKLDKENYEKNTHTKNTKASKKKNM